MIKRTKLELKPPRSIYWQDNSLIDWIEGGRKITLAGKEERGSFFLEYDFDSVKVLHHSAIVVIYKKLGAKGVILKEGKLLREINRSYYFANHYEYPVALLHLPTHEPAIIHCPDEYCSLEIELIDTGERLTPNRKPRDIFYSRLDANDTYVLSAGWIWHPFDILTVYRIDDLLKGDHLKEESNLTPGFESEITSARFSGEHKIIVSTSKENELPRTKEAIDFIQSGSIGIYDLKSKYVIKQIRPKAEFGNVVPINEDYVWDLYNYPKVINLNTGEVEEQFEDLKTGKQNSSVISKDDEIKSIAIDKEKNRIAIITDTGIEVLELLK